MARELSYFDLRIIISQFASIKTKTFCQAAFDDCIHSFIHSFRSKSTTEIIQALDGPASSSSARNYITSYILYSKAIMVCLPITTDFRQSAVSAGSCIQRAIRDEDFDLLPDLITDLILLWQCNSRGWAAMHVASSSQPPVYWWKWLLQKAMRATKPERLYKTKTDMGQTCIDLFVRQSLFPLAWQRHTIQEKADQLRESIQTVCDDSSTTDNQIMLVELRERIRYSKEQKEENEDFEDHIESSPVGIVFQFWKNLELLLCAAHYGTVDTACFLEMGEIPYLQLLASHSWCPDIAARLLVRLFPEPLPLVRHPLHVWAKTKTSIYSEDAGMLRTLCQAYPIQK